MPRLKPEQWEKARAEYEVRGVSFKVIAELFGVTKSAVALKARQEIWQKGKLDGLVEKKANALKELAEVNEETLLLPESFQKKVSDAAYMRAKVDVDLANFDRALLAKGREILPSISKPEELEAMSRISKNLSRQPKEQQTTVNVNQQASQVTVVDKPLPQAIKTVGRILRGDFEGDD